MAKYREGSIYYETNRGKWHASVADPLCLICHILPYFPYYLQPKLNHKATGFTDLVGRFVVLIYSSLFAIIPAIHRSNTLLSVASGSHI